MEKERQVVGRCQKHRKYRALEAEGDENQRKYRVVELEKVKTPGKKNIFFCAGNVVQLGKVKNSGKKRVFCGGKSKNMVNSVVVNVEKERKKGCWKVSKTSQIPCFGSRGR